MKILNALLLSLCLGAGTLLPAHAADATIAERIVRAKPAGVDLIMYPMEVRDVVTMMGSIPYGRIGQETRSRNPAIAPLTAMMLNKGSTRRDKYAIEDQLLSSGINLGFTDGGDALLVRVQSLAGDMPISIEAMAEQLRDPSFPESELERVKQDLTAATQGDLDSTGKRASVELGRLLYPEGNPNRPVTSAEMLAAIPKVTVADLKAFHAAVFGPAHMTLVVTGDVKPADVEGAVQRAFAGWSGGVPTVRDVQPMSEPAARSRDVAMADKPSASVVIGQRTGLRMQDQPDNLALSVGTEVLGSGFTGRLMNTVRNQEGLTYGIGAGLSNNTMVDGAFVIGTSFAPELMARGIESTRRELRKWWQEGITEEELKARKSNLAGGLLIGIGNTTGMAGALLNCIDSGRDVDCLDRYLLSLDALTAGQVNAAIRKYLDPDKMVIVRAGTLSGS